LLSSKGGIGKANDESANTKKRGEKRESQEVILSSILRKATGTKSGRREEAAVNERPKTNRMCKSERNRTDKSWKKLVFPRRKAIEGLPR